MLRHPRFLQPLAILAVALSLAGIAHADSQVRIGTGIAVSRATHIVTNAHVAANCTSLRILLGSQQAAGQLVAVDPDADLAIVKTSLPVPKTIAIRSSPPLRLGDSVIAFGFPLSGSLSEGGNLTTGNVSALAGLRDDGRYLQMTAPVQPGNSGGPLLDGGANLVGVITSKLDALAMAKRTGDIPQNVNFAIKTSVLESFLQANKVPYDVAATDKLLSAANVGNVAKNGTVKIVCEPSGTQTADTQNVAVAPNMEPVPVPVPVPPPTEAAPTPPAPAAEPPAVTVTPVPPPPGDATGRVVPVPVPQAVPPRGQIPVPADAGQREMAEQIQVVDVRTPYPGTAPAMREIEIRNGAPYSVLQITVGWLQQLPGPQCPRSPSAYLGTKELFAGVKPGQSATLTGEFSAQARYFCIVSAQFTPAARRAQQTVPAANVPAPEPAPR